MLKHHHHNGASVSSSRRRRSHLHQTSSRSVPEVGIIPGNRFFLLPLKKVTALMRPHTPCRETSATKTKPCIVSKPKQASSHGAQIHRESLLQEFYVRSQAHSKSSRLIAKQRRRRSVVAKTRLSPVCEQASGVAEQELLLEYERLLWNDGRLVDTRNCRTVGVSNRSRAKDTSIFTLGETTLLESHRGASLAASSTQMLQDINLNPATQKKKRSNSFSNASDIDLVLYRSSRKTHTKSRFSVSTPTERECMVSGGRSFGRNNRVSPSSLSHGQQLHPEFGTCNDCATSFGIADDLETPRNKNRSNSRATSFGKADDLETPRNKNRSNSRATSFGKADDLETPRNRNRSNSRAPSFGKADDLETPRNRNRSNSRAPSFGKADDLETPRNRNRSNSRAPSFGKADDLETPRNRNRSNSRATSFGKADDLETPRNRNRSNSRATSFGKADELVTPRNKNRSNSRATSFGKADELETPRNKNRSKSRATSFGKADDLVTPRDKNRSKSRGNFTTSTKADELVPELEMPWNKDRSNFRDNCTTSFSKADELVTLFDKNRSNFRGNSTTSFDKGDEIVKLCDKNRRKSRGHRRTSFGKADEILIRDKKRRNFSFWGCSHQIRSCSPFLCSFTNKNDLPVSPSPLQLSRRLQN